MDSYVLGINPTTEGTGEHDPSAVLFIDGQPVYGAEEERFSREKHAFNTFPKNAIEACLDFKQLHISDIDKVIIPWQPRKGQKNNVYNIVRNRLNTPLRAKCYHLLESVLTFAVAPGKIELELSRIGTPVPPIEFENHHLCHAASAFFPSGFENALILTADGQGNRYSTVVWKGTPGGIEKIQSYNETNSLGKFYSAITVFLGYRANNGEGKVMGLAPYGSPNEGIEETLRGQIDTGANYDVTEIAGGGVENLEGLFDRERVTNPGEFSDWEKDLAFVAQSILEEIVSNIVSKYCKDLDTCNVCLAGGVALNCKMNKRIIELDAVDNAFIQPIAHDAGTALGAGLLQNRVSNVSKMENVYLGSEYTTEEIIDSIEEFKLDYSLHDDLERVVAEQLADGALVGWYQGRLEMGPRALGNRSILADPRTEESRDRVNEFVKHRESWRPFAPSLLEGAIEEYLISGEPAPFMIKTFDVPQDVKDDISAVLHPADDTTRPQTVREDQNKRYYDLIKAFEAITGVPVVLNTSFNDRGEPIVRTPTEAIKDFFAMGLDILVIEDVLLKKEEN